MKKRIAINVALLVALLCAVIFAAYAANVRTAWADDESLSYNYGFYYEKFDVTFDVASNREIAVREEMTVTFTGHKSTGYMRDIPVNGGEIVKNISVSEIVNGVEKPADYSVYPYENNGVDYVTADIGDTTYKTNQTHTYVLTYDYCLTKAQEGKNVLAINAIGAQDRRVEQANVTLILPDGFIGAKCYAGSVLSESELDFKTSVKDGRTVLFASYGLAHDEGITFRVDFEEGALTTYFDFTPYYFVLAGLGLIFLVVAVKFLVFNRNKIIPVINYEAPEKMSPLMMGKLIDGNVDTEDITSMLFYWADKGYIKIDLSNEDNPTLIRITQTLPEDTPSYEKKLYDGLWKSGDAVRVSSLKYKFYKTIDKVKAEVNSQVKGLYESTSRTVSVLFAVLGGLLFAASSFICAYMLFSYQYLLIRPVVFVMPFTLVMYVIFMKVREYSMKNRNGKKINFWALFIGFLVLLFGLGFTTLTPSFIIPFLPKLLIMYAGFAVAILSTYLVTRTREYTEKLNGITGFADFIAKAEKRQLETLIEENPQFYYHVLPYAQVLGISKVWEDKFADITIEPPQWCVGSTIFEYYAINRIIRHSASAMRSNMGSRPSSSSGGSGRGGFGGGHVGGGHGGGGSRGR